MRVLLDTHIFLWLVVGDPRLPPVVESAVRDGENDVFLSAVSLWEASVKHALGKLPMPSPPASYLPEQRRRHSILPLPLDEDDVSRLEGLPMLHRDPFDRMLVCQALARDLVLATVDPAVRAYPVRLLPG